VARGARRDRRASPGSARRPTSCVVDLEAVILDQGIHEQLLAHLFGFVSGGTRRRRGYIEHDIAPDAHRADVGEAETLERALGRAALRIKDPLTWGDEDLDDQVGRARAQYAVVIILRPGAAS